ncbi:MAG TPA: GDP-mannose 4,6-dehydratase [Candidatus Thermoplasmatota archaeon]|nr:GDP-mannose 4,6-dehydratase [Candidatus Thermoplasmatota archaeon]
MKRALITGITGQDGSYLAELLLQKGYEVHGLVRRLSVPNFSNLEAIKDRIVLHDGDMLDSASLQRIAADAKPDEVYNLAAQSFVHVSFGQPVLTSDVTGVSVFRLLEAVRQRAPDARFYQASSSEMFGLAAVSPQDERTPFHPRSPYGVAKVMAFWATVNHRESYGMYATNGILFNHESPRRGLEFVTRKIARGVARIAEGLDRKLVLGNLDAKRDWGYAPEYVEGMWRMLQHPQPDDFVLATGESHTIREFCELAFKEVGVGNWEKHVESDPRFFRPAEVHALCGDATKARTLLGWKPKTTFPQLVSLMVQAERERLRAKP